MSEILTVIFSSLFAFIIADRTAKSNENLSLKQHVNEQKKDVYISFIELLTDITVNKKKYSDEELKNLMGEMRKKFIIYASKEVLQAFNNWTAHATKEQYVVFPNIDKLLFEMRKDIGINDGVWSKNELTRIQVLLRENLKEYFKDSDTKK